LQRARRHRRVRKRVRGCASRPRLVVFRSLKHMEGQLVDDDLGRTLVGLSTKTAALREFVPESRNPGVERARAAGRMLAEAARAEGVRAAVFDRGGYQYHGRVKAFAEGAREGGLSF
jgi:large subunit ribosomal protein L18